MNEIQEHWMHTPNYNQNKSICITQYIKNCNKYICIF